MQIYLEFEKSPIRALAELLEKRGLTRGRIGIEKNFLVANTLEEMAESMPKATLLGADHIFDKARAIKGSAEIAILSRAAILTEQAILDAFQAAQTGDTEKKVADDLSMRVLYSGATSHWIVLAAGSNTAINHPYAGSKKFEPGEIVRVDIGGIFQGYQSDVARTAVVGTPSERQRSVYRHLRDAQRETVEAARAGVRACDLYNTFRLAFQKRGLYAISQAVGHGLGVGLHEYPVLHAGETAVIKPGMVLNIEPAVKDSQGYLYHLEDLLVVTEGEPQIVTNVMDTEELFRID